MAKLVIKLIAKTMKFIYNACQMMAFGTLTMIYIFNKEPTIDLLLTWFAFGLVMEFLFRKFSRSSKLFENHR